MDDREERTVFDVLEEKHPSARPADEEALVTTTEDPPEVQPIIFQSLTGAQIRKAALRIQGSAGPSGVDAIGWRRLCTGFKRESNDLCEAIAAVGRRLCSDLVDPRSLQALPACWLIPVNKNPGVRPIGVCEVIRRILGKAILSVVKQDVVAATGPLQLAGGLDGGCEAAVHGMNALFEKEETEALMFVDAENSFNNLNRRVALWNI